MIDKEWVKKYGTKQTTSSQPSKSALTVVKAKPTQTISGVVQAKPNQTVSKVVQAGNQGQVLAPVSVASNFVGPVKSFVGPVKPVDLLAVKPLPQQPNIVSGGQSQFQNPTFTPQTSRVTPQDLQPTVNDTQLSELRNQSLNVTGVNGSQAPLPIPEKLNFGQNINKFVQQDLPNAAVGLFRGVIRGETAAARWLAEQGPNGSVKMPEYSTEGASKLEKAIADTIIGKEKIPTVSEYGKEMLPKFAEKGPIPFIVGAGMIALDFTGFGGAKNAIKALSATNKIDDIYKIGRSIGIAEDLLKEYAPILAKTSKESEVAKIISHIDEVQKTTAASTKSLQLPSAPAKTLPKLEQKAVTKLPQISKEISYIKSVPENKLFYNYDKLNISETAKTALKQEIAKVESKTERLIGKKLTHQEWIDRANEIKVGLGKTMTKGEMKDFIAKNYNSQRKLAELGKMMESGETVSPEKLKNIFSEAKSGATFGGRLLESMKETRTPLSVALLKEMDRAGKLTDDIFKKAAMIDWTNEKAVAQFYRDQVKAGISEWVDLLRYNSMLSSPNTWLVNLFAGAQSLVVQPLTKILTGTFDFIGTLGGTVRPRSAYAGEGVAYVGGIFKNAGNKLTRLVKKITGQKLPELTKIVDPEYAQRVPLSKPGTVARVAERALDWPGRIMQGTDEFVASFAKAGEQASLGYRSKKGITLTAEQIAEKSSEAAKYALFRKGNEAEGKILGAIQHVSDLLSELRSSTNPVLKWPAKFTFPFVNIATQLTKQGIEFSPLGLTTLWGATNKIEQLAKAAIGTTTAVLVATLLGSDRLTYGRPIGKNQQKAFDDAGMKAYSVKIGNKWIPYAKLHPAFAFNFAFVAGIKQAIEEGKLGESKSEMLLAAFARSFNFIADQSYLRNVGDFVAGTKGDVSGFTRMVSNYPAQLVPYRAMLSYINRLIDYTEKEVNPDAGLIEKQMQYIQRQIPGLSGKMPSKVNRDGEPITDDNPWLNAISGFGRIGTVKPEAEKYYRNMQSMNKTDREKTQQTTEAKKPIQKIYDEAQKLKAAGKVDEANRIVNALSPTEQKLYLDIKTAAKTANTKETEIDIFDIYKKAQELKAQGKADEANRMVNALSPAEQKAYLLLKNRYKDIKF